MGAGVIGPRGLCLKPRDRIRERRWLAQLLGLGQQVAGVAGAAGANGLGPLDLAVLADQDRGTVADARLLEPEAVGGGHAALGVKVGQEREGDETDPGMAWEAMITFILGSEASPTSCEITVSCSCMKLSG